MSTYKTTGIILRRTDYQEADRIFTILTPLGKVSAIAKSVRRLNAKLARHLDVFAEIELMLAKGRNLDVVTSARIQRQYHLSEDYERMRRGFLFMEMADRLTDTDQTAEVYDVVATALAALETGDSLVAELAFKLQLLDALGQAPRLDREVGTDRPLRSDQWYRLDYNQGGFVQSHSGDHQALSPDAIKLWRLIMRVGTAKAARVENATAAAQMGLTACDKFYTHLYSIQFRSQQF